METIILKTKDIGNLLLEYGLINDNDLKSGLEYQKGKNLRLGEALVELGKISSEDIEYILSKQLNIPYILVENININKELIGKFHRNFLIEHRILPLHESDDHISIVIEDPFNSAAIDVIEESSGKKADLSTGSGNRIVEILKRFFKLETLPDLLSAVEAVIGRIKNTSFYRLDFLLYDDLCKINVFGAGILHHIGTVKGYFQKEDILRVFDSLNISFLYDKLQSPHRSLLVIYPLVNKSDTISMPTITGIYGLILPDDMTFTDTRVRGLANLCYSKSPVPGYPYISTKGLITNYDLIIYPVDTAPDCFKNYNAKISIPKKCSVCAAAGCETCNNLGYDFSPLEDVISLDELKEKLTEE